MSTDPAAGRGIPEPYSPGDCKTRRRQAPPRRWELCRSFLSWPWPGERDTGRLRARPGLCPAAPTCRAFQRLARACTHSAPSRPGQPSGPHPFQRLTSLLPSLSRPISPVRSSCSPDAPSSRPLLSTAPPPAPECVTVGMEMGRDGWTEDAESCDPQNVKVPELFLPSRDPFKCHSCLCRGLCRDTWLGPIC